MTTVLVPAAAGEMLSSGERLRVTVAAFLARYTGLSRAHTASDLRGFLDWCADRGVDPLAASRPQLELFVRWMQETRRLKPSTVSRRTSVVAGFYRTCVIDGVLEHSPAEHLRRPRVPPESPTLGLTHLQFEALLTCSKPADPTCLIWGRSTATASYASSARAARSSSSPCRPRSDAPSTWPSTTGRWGRSCGPAAARGWTGTPPPGDCDGWPRRRGCGCRGCTPHMLRHTFVTTMLDAGVALRVVQIAARHADPRTTMRYDRARKNLDRHPNYVLAAFMASGT